MIVKRMTQMLVLKLLSAERKMQVPKVARTGSWQLLLILDYLRVSLRTVSHFLKIMGCSHNFPARPCIKWPIQMRFFAGDISNGSTNGCCLKMKNHVANWICPTIFKIVRLATWALEWFHHRWVQTYFNLRWGFAIEKHYAAYGNAAYLANTWCISIWLAANNLWPMHCSRVSYSRAGVCNRRPAGHNPARQAI